MKDTNRRYTNDLEKTAHLPEKSLVEDTIFPAGLQVLRTRDPSRCLIARPQKNHGGIEIYLAVQSWQNL